MLTGTRRVHLVVQGVVQNHLNSPAACTAKHLSLNLEVLALPSGSPLMLQIWRCQNLPPTQTAILVQANIEMPNEVQKKYLAGNEFV